MTTPNITDLSATLAGEAREPVRRLTVAIAKQRPPTTTQSLIFEKEKFKTAADATKWARDHDFKADKVDETETSFRLRQHPPADFVSTSFRTIELAPGVSAVIGRLRAEFREETSKAAPQKRKRTREYLERALQLARKALPGWAYAALVRSARSHAGGKTRARLRAEERLMLNKTSPGEMTPEELTAARKRLRALAGALKRKKQDGSKIESLLGRVEREMIKRRLLKTEGLTSKAADEVVKGFVSGQTDGGAHAHGLDRAAGKTSKDGRHRHVFARRSGEILYTHHDGDHEHMLDGGDDGAHSHHVVLSDETIVATSIDGAHSHGKMLETTHFDAEHRHTLKLPDGGDLVSMTVDEWVERFGIPPATTIPQADMITHVFAELCRPASPPIPSDLESTFELPSVEQAIALTAKGADVAPVFEVVGELVDIADDPAVIRFGGSDDVWTASIHKTDDFEPGDLVRIAFDGQSLSVVDHALAVEPADASRVESLLSVAEELAKVATLDFVGPEVAPVVFVAHQPTPLEAARGEPLVGPDGVQFADLYLAPLGLAKSQVAVGFAVPTAVAGAEKVDWSDRLETQLARWPEAIVVALGREARRLVGKRASVYLPHPGAVRKRGDRGEVARKLKSLRKTLDKPSTVVDTVNNAGRGSIPKRRTSGTPADDTGGSGIAVSIAKSAEEKQIVYGVVLDPYRVDLQDDWVPPADVESTAHDFAARSRVIGFEHVSKADATLIESWVESYPSPEDYQAAMENLPHKATRRQFGSDRITSGSWAVGVRLGDGLWEMHKQGKLNAFSIGGFSFKTKVTEAAMPEVEFVDLEPRV